MPSISELMAKECLEQWKEMYLSIFCIAMISLTSVFTRLLGSIKMNRLIVLGIISILSSCQPKTELPNMHMQGSWRWISKGGDFQLYEGIPINYRELYINEDYISFYDVVSKNSPILWHIENNTLYLNHNNEKIGTLQPLTDKKILLIHQQGVDTLTFIPDLIVTQSTFEYNNEVGLQKFRRGFEQRMSKYYLETLGVDFNAPPSEYLVPQTEIIEEIIDIPIDEK
jgi:hypothetical protein